MRIFWAVLFGTLLFTQSAIAQKVRTIPAKNFFGYYDKYLSMPAADRDGVNISYSMFVKSGNLQGLNLVVNGQKTKLNRDNSGKFTKLPSLFEMQNGAVEMIGDGKGGVNLNAEPNILPARTIDANSINNSIDDLRKCMKLAGVLALAIPKLEALSFEGVNSANVIFNDGHKIQLNAKNNKIYIKPNQATFKNYVRIEFPNPPSKINFEQ
jgi:hypothetical protein